MKIYLDVEDCKAVKKKRSESYQVKCVPLAEYLCEGALRSGDVGYFSGLKKWAEWLAEATVVLDENDYLAAALRALLVALRLAPTDFGHARQRDLMQAWADTLRGFLGELAFKKWLQERFSCPVELDWEVAQKSLDEYLQSDVVAVGGRRPGLRISVKTAKLNALWLDVPFDQIEHSDVFVLMRIGVPRDHILKFFKEISIIKDKLVASALKRGLIREDEARALINGIKDFRGVPAYFAGFYDRNERLSRSSEGLRKLKEECGVLYVKAEVREARRKGKQVQLVKVKEFEGFWNPSSPKCVESLLSALKEQGVPVDENMHTDVEFEGIREFSNTDHFIVNSGRLEKDLHKWEIVLKKLGCSRNEVLG
ncbi:MAG: hypothetical protein GXO07_02980 [Crenarchaeota archaeon]|nr:hypothetical protein [Thermoproteota archaeon]